MISCGELAWPVDNEPSCPVFIARSISSASAPLHSPTIILSGLIRRAVPIRSLIVIGVTPSVFAFLVSSLTIFLAPRSCSSAESSIVIILSSSGIYCDRAFGKVVFPEPVPPRNKYIVFGLRQYLQKPCHLRRESFYLNKPLHAHRMLRNFLIDTAEPPIDMGFSTIFTLEPSLSLVSTIGDASIYNPVMASHNLLYHILQLLFR